MPSTPPRDNDGNMKKLSANVFVINFLKEIFPVLWFGSLLAFVATGRLGEDLLFVMLSLGMGIFGYILIMKQVRDLVDEVYDCGDNLLVKNAGQQEMIPLSNIMQVNAFTLMNPPRITLRLVRPATFGSEVSFSPITRLSLNPFAKNQIVEDLIARVDRARAQRTV